MPASYLQCAVVSYSMEGAHNNGLSLMTDSRLHFYHAWLTSIGSVLGLSTRRAVVDSIKRSSVFQHNSNDDGLIITYHGRNGKIVFQTCDKNQPDLEAIGRDMRIVMNCQSVLPKDPSVLEDISMRCLSPSEEDVSDAKRSVDCVPS